MRHRNMLPTVQLQTNTITTMNLKAESMLQFIRFGLVGVANTLIDFAIFIFLTRIVGFSGSYIYLANTFSFACAATFSLFVNKYWTFGHTHKTTKEEAIKFYTTTTTGFLLGTLILYIFVSRFGIYDLIAKACATVVTVCWNFFLTKFWAFKSTQEITQ
jgi:putative flippase GtrA